MLYSAGTDWFLLSWRLLPLPNPHMAESARSSFSAWTRMCVCLCVYNKQIYVYACNSEKGVGGQKQMSLFKEKSNECDSECVCACCVCKHVCPSVFFAIRQCVKMSRFDCRRFMSHKWWLTVHPPRKQPHKCRDTQTRIRVPRSLACLHPLTVKNMCRQPYSCIFTLSAQTHTHSPTQQASSKGYCVWVGAVFLSIHVCMCE